MLLGTLSSHIGALLQVLATSLLKQLSDNHVLGRQWVMTQVLGLLPSIWEFQMKLRAPDFGLGRI